MEDRESSQQNLERSILHRLTRCGWKTCLELYIELGWPDGPEGKRAYGIAPIQLALMDLKRSGYVLCRQRVTFGALCPPDEYGISEAGQRFGDMPNRRKEASGA